MGIFLMGLSSNVSNAMSNLVRLKYGTQILATPFRCCRLTVTTRWQWWSRWSRNVNFWLVWNIGMGQNIQNPVPLVNITIVGKWLFISLSDGMYRYWSIAIYVIFRAWMTLLLMCWKHQSSYMTSRTKDVSCMSLPVPLFSGNMVESCG